MRGVTFEFLDSGVVLVDLSSTQKGIIGVPRLVRTNWMITDEGRLKLEIGRYLDRRLIAMSDLPEIEFSGDDTLILRNGDRKMVYHRLPESINL